MTATTLVVWASVAWCLVMAGLSTWMTVRTRRANRRLARYWADQAPPVPPVVVRLVNGETVTVKPYGPQHSWTWWLPLPAPNLVDEVLIPELPPWTNVIPVPDDWPKLAP